MSSGIRLSGMSSGLDTESIVEALISAKSEKKTTLEGDQKKLSWKQDAWKTLNSKIYSFYSKTVSNLRFKSDFTKRKTTATSDAVSVTASSSAPCSVQTMNIVKMAKASYYTGAELQDADGNKASYSTSTKISEMYGGTTGSFNIQIGSNTATTITVDENTTISNVVSQLNKAGVTANFDTKNQRLFISSNNTGTENGFSLTGDDALLGALGLSATPDGSDPDATVSRGKFIKAQDAEIRLNGETFRSASNTFDVNGLTITVNKEIDEDEDITLNTQQDTSGIYDMVKNFFKEYNELINEMDKLYNADSAKNYKMLTKEEKEEMSEDEIKEWEDKIKGALLKSDSTLSTVASAMKSIMLQGVTMTSGDTTYKMFLSDFGINTAGYFSAADNEKNAYHIDGDSDDSTSSSNEDKLKAMISSDPDKVANFFSGLAKNLYDQLGELMGRSEYSSAFTVYNDKLMDTQYKEYTTKISEQEKKITTWEDYYYSKFTAMEKALTTLNSKQTAISGLLGS